MKKILKGILWLIVIALIVAQFFHLDKNVSATPAENHISKVFSVPVDVQNILEKSCNDCHSNNSHYYWYMSVQPVEWWLAEHIEDGKDEINFDEFASYSLRRQFHKLKEIKEQVEEDEMPISSYTLVHSEAKLSAEQKQTLIKWSEDIMNDLRSKYPIDSLERKRK
jgi:hypothetical protein